MSYYRRMAAVIPTLSSSKLVALYVFLSFVIHNHRHSLLTITVRYNDKSPRGFLPQDSNTRSESITSSITSIMCLVSVREEEDLIVPARRVKEVRQVRRVREFSPPPPPLTRRVSRTTIIRESAPSPPRTEIRQPSRPPSIAPSHAPTRASHRYVQVDHEASSSSSSSSSEEDVRSQVTRKTTKSHHSRAPSVPVPPSVRSAPRTEYSMHENEREFRREVSRPRGPDYETYRYVNAPPSERPRSEFRDSRLSGEELRRIQVSIRNNR